MAQNLNIVVGGGILFLYFAIVPMIIGVVGDCIFCGRRTARISGAYIWGNIILWAIFQILCVPMGIMEISFNTLVVVYAIVVLMLCIISICIQRKNNFYIIHSAHKAVKSFKWLEWLLLLLIFFQIYILLFYITSWGSGDDACYIATSLDAVEHNSIAHINYYTGVSGGVSLKIVLTSWNYYISFLSKISGLHVAIVARDFLPIVLIILAYMVYYLFSGLLFEHNRKKRTIFLLCLTVLFIFGGYTVYNLTFRLDVCVWQGKAVMATIMLPFLFWYLLQGMENQDCQWIGVIFIAIATCAMSLMGVGLSILIIVGIIVAKLQKGNAKRMIPLLIIALSISGIAVYYYVRLYYSPSRFSYEMIKQRFFSALHMAWETNSVYWSDSLCMCIYMAALIYLYCRKEKEQTHKTLLKYITYQYLLIFNPIVFNIAYLFFQSSIVYVRLYYVLFPELYLAYALTLFIYDLEDCRKRVTGGILILLLTIISGRPYWELADFLPAENLYKIPQESIEVCNIINADSLNESPRALVADNLNVYIRQYSSRIEMLYGRGGAGYSYNGENLFLMIQNGQISMQEIVLILKENNCDYLVWKNVRGDIEEVIDMGGHIVGITEKYCVIRMDKEQEDI